MGKSLPQTNAAVLVRPIPHHPRGPLIKKISSSREWFERHLNVHSVWDSPRYCTHLFNSVYTNSKSSLTYCLSALTLTINTYNSLWFHYLKLKSKTHKNSKAKLVIGVTCFHFSSFQTKHLHPFLNKPYVWVAENHQKMTKNEEGSGYLELNIFWDKCLILKRLCILD